MSKKVIVSVTNDLSTDQRVHKVCQSLLSMGFAVELVGRIQSFSQPIKREYVTTRLKSNLRDDISSYLVAGAHHLMKDGFVPLYLVDNITILIVIS